MTDTIPARPPQPAGPISLLVTDVDGTLVTHDKTLAASTIAAAARLRSAGIALAAVSSRPPRGMLSIAVPLALELFGGFNGGAIVLPDLTPVEEHFVPEAAAREAIETLTRTGADVWVFSQGSWFVTDAAGAYVARERHTVGFDPTVVADFAGHLATIGKIVGSSSDFDRLARTEAELQASLGKAASARRSQRYYLDITSPDSDKGHAVRAFAAHWGVPVAEVAVIGDMANDVPMFAVAGLSIAMGNAPPEVARQAQFSTGSNDEDGWARAIDEIVIPRAAARSPA